MKSFSVASFYFIDEGSNFLLDFLQFYITWNKVEPIQMMQREAKREETEENKKKM